MNKSIITKEQLATENEGKLLFKYALPSITALLINSFYNIVDQIFIGHGVGYLGNTATNIAFPLTVFTMGLSLLFAHGNSAYVNIKLGQGDIEGAREASCTSAFYSFSLLTIITILCFIFIRPILYLFGATDTSYALTKTYTSIILLGVPIHAIAIVFSNIIKADGNPTYSMLSLSIGAILNCFLDPLFIFVFKWGVAGGALATITGQYVSFLITFIYIRKNLTNFTLSPKYINLKSAHMGKVVSLGMSTFTMRICTVIINVLLNNTLRTYGALSIYGADIVLAASGIVQKLMTVLQSFVQGLANGQQPIIGFNYGAGHYDRVRRTLKISIISSFSFAMLFWFASQFFTEQLIGLFGSDNPLYVEFGIICLKTKFRLVFVMGLSFITSYFYQSIGKPMQSIAMTLLRQFGFLVPAMVILPKFYGIMGALYAYPVTDVFTAITASIFIYRGFKYLKEKEEQEEGV